MTTKILVVKEAEKIVDEGEEEEMDVIKLEIKQMIVDVLVLPLLPKQKKRRKDGSR